jgi:hypothetical protein
MSGKERYRALRLQMSGKETYRALRLQMSGKERNRALRLQMLNGFLSYVILVLQGFPENCAFLGTYKVRRYSSNHS